MFFHNQFSIAFLSLFKCEYHDRSFIQITVDTSIRFHERQAVRRKWYKRLTRISFSTLRNHENFRQMREGHKGTSVQGERNADAWWRREKIEGEREKGGPGDRGSCICHNLIWLHNRIPTRRDHPCQQVTYFFFISHPLPHSPLFFVLPAAPLLSFYCRDFVVVTNSRRLFDPLSRFPFARRDARDTEPSSSFPDNPFADSGTGESL